MQHETTDCVFTRQPHAEATNKPPGPKQVFKYREKLKNVVTDFIASMATAETINELSESIASTVTKINVNEDDMVVYSGYNSQPVLYGIRSSLQCTLAMNAKITYDALYSTAHRFAGNMVALKAGCPITPWIHQSYSEWVLARVNYVTRNVLGVEIYSGLAAGLRLDIKLWPRDFELLYTTAGLISTRELDSVYLHPNELSSCWIQLHIPEGSTLKVSNVRITQTLKNLNKQLKAKRVVETRECPKDFSWPCHACPLGRSECSLAVREKRPEIGMCINGHEGFLLKEDKGLCVTCAVNEWGQARGLDYEFNPPKLQRKQEHDSNTVQGIRPKREGNDMGVSVAGHSTHDAACNG